MRAATARVFLVAVVVTIATTASTSRAAHAAGFAAESITGFDSDVTIEASGALRVRETIAYDFGDVPHHGIFRDIPVRVDYPPRPRFDRVYPLTVLSVRASPGT